MDKKALEQANLSVSAMRSLVIDMTNKAHSGHPGMALDIALSGVYAAAIPYSMIISSPTPLTPRGSTATASFFLAAT